MKPISINDMIADYIVNYALSNNYYDYFEFNIDNYFKTEASTQ